MALMKWGGNALVLTGNLMKADGFEEWTKDLGKNLIEQYASDQVKGLFKTQRATSSIKSAFKDFMSHEGFRNKVDAEVTTFFETLGDHFNRIEDNQYLAEKKVFALPRCLVHDFFDDHLRQSLSASGDLETLEETLKTSFPHIQQSFLDYFIPAFRPVLMRHIEMINFKKGKELPRLNDGWLLVGCEKTSNWTPEKEKGHYSALQTKTNAYSAKRASVALERMSVNIFNSSLGRRREIVKILTDSIREDEEYERDYHHEEIWADY